MQLEATVIPLTALPTAHPSSEAEGSAPVTSYFAVTDAARRGRQ
jgi:hypothetical protein